MCKRLAVVSLLVAVSSVALPVFAEPVIREILFIKKTTLTVPRTYTFRFSLWDAEDLADLAGTMIWSEDETIDLTVKKIRHDLGSVESLGGVDFSQQLWVQVDRWKKKSSSWAPVGARVMLRVVPYALFSETVGADVITSGEILDGTVTAADLEDGAALSEILDNDGAGSGLDADTVDGLHAGEIASSSHVHDGSDIITGAVSEIYVDPLIARDSEVTSALSTHAATAEAHHIRYSDTEAVSAVKAADGSGSGLDADLLDGQQLADLDARFEFAQPVQLRSFTTLIVDHEGMVGSLTSITIGSDGLPLIAYRDDTNMDLKVAHCMDATCASATLSTLDSVGEVGYYPSITVGTDGLGIISYWDSTTGDAKVAHCNDIACSSATIHTVDDTAASIGWFMSITIGNDGLPIMSYYDWTNGDLEVAHCTDTVCSSATLNTVDSEGDVGGWTSMAIGLDGLPIISYYDWDYHNLKVARCNDAGCASATISTIDASPNAPTAITIGADRLPIIAYRDGDNLDLEVAHCNDAFCTSATLSTLDSVGDVGAYSSITIGTDGMPIISYWDWTNGDLKVAYCTDSACSSATLDTVDSEGFIGDYGSITIGADGLPIISYHDGYECNLKVAHGFVRTFGRR